VTVDDNVEPEMKLLEDLSEEIIFLEKQRIRVFEIRYLISQNK